MGNNHWKKGCLGQRQRGIGPRGSWIFLQGRGEDQSNLLPPSHRDTPLPLFISLLYANYRERREQTVFNEICNRGDRSLLDRHIDRS